MGFPHYIVTIGNIVLFDKDIIINITANKTYIIFLTWSKRLKQS